MLDVRLLSGPSRGQRLLLPRMRLDNGAQELPFILRRRQFPVRLAWAMSIHKAQGQTLTCTGVYLPDPVFTHGQLYVAASRSSTPSGLKFLLGKNLGHGFQDSEDNEFDGPYTHNIVYRQVLQQSLNLDDPTSHEETMRPTDDTPAAETPASQAPPTKL